MRTRSIQRPAPDTCRPYPPVLMPTRRWCPAPGPLSARPAFSLVELMIVIVVILLLVAILLPVLNKAYKTALATADSALIHQIAMGCESYHHAFGEYPISDWTYPAPSAGGLATSFDWPPYQRGGRTLLSTGAAKVFASLVGFNTAAVNQTDPGCWESVSAGTWRPGDPRNWGARCGELTYRGIVSTLMSDPTVEDRTYGPYYVPADKQKTPTTVDYQGGPSGGESQMVFASRFERPVPVPPPTTAAVNLGAETGAPILYYRANPNARHTGLNGSLAPWDIYRYEDNLPITDPGKQWISPNADRRFHPLYAPSDGKNAGNTNYNDYPGSWGPPPQDRFFGISHPLIRNGQPQTPPTYNADTYILISPGPDGKYFTDDDITNFK